jgi:hypothetical protein
MPPGLLVGAARDPDKEVLKVRLTSNLAVAIITPFLTDSKSFTLILERAQRLTGMANSR